MSFSDVFDNDINLVIKASDARQKRENELIKQIGHLLRWQTAMIIKGYHDPKGIKRTDWDIFHEEYDKRMSERDFDLEKYEEIWKKMDAARAEELKQQRNG